MPLCGLGASRKSDMTPVFETIETRRFSLDQGCSAGDGVVAMVPTDAEIVELIRIAELPEAVEAARGYPTDPTGLRKWVAAAAAGWPRELVREFLERCSTTTDHGLKLAAEQSLKGKYVKWRPY